MQDPWHQMTVDHILPPPNEWDGREITPDNYAHGWEAGRRQKSQLAISFG